MSFVPFMAMKGCLAERQDVGGAEVEECPVGTTLPSDVQGGTEDQTWSGKLALDST